MVEDFDSVRSEAIKYAMDMNRKSTNNNNTAFNNRTRNKRLNFISDSITNSKNNNDIGLIIALILLLSQDGTDMPLMLALIYIMT